GLRGEEPVRLHHAGQRDPHARRGVRAAAGGAVVARGAILAAPVAAGMWVGRPVLASGHSFEPLISGGPMPTVRDLRVRQGQVLLMAGTSKGVFLFAAGPKRDKWERGGPQFAGSPTYSLGHDHGNGDGQRIFAGVENPFYGPTIRWSDDLGRTWSDETASTLKFPEDAGVSLKRIWQIVPGSRNGTLYAGVEPSALFVSPDRGASWQLVRGLFDH